MERGKQMSKSETTRVIIRYNRIINSAISDKDFFTAQKFLLKLHKIECKEHVPIGTYRLKVEVA